MVLVPYHDSNTRNSFKLLSKLVVLPDSHSQIVLHNGGTIQKSTRGMEPIQTIYPVCNEATSPSG
jgi:hypothetical protein